MVSSNGSRPYAGAGSSAVNEAKEKLKGVWMDAWQIILTAVVAAVLLGLVMYYTVAELFETGHELYDIGWSSTGGGIVMILLVIIAIGSAAACFGLGHKENSSSIMFTAGSAAILGFVYYFVFASIKDNKKSQLAGWSLLAIVLNIGLAFYAWWSLRGINNELKAKSEMFESADRPQIPVRFKWASVCFGVSVLFSLVTAGGLYQIYGHVNSV